ncbi:MAG TPA: MarR family transcriptional regulator [Xanthobacteraceae bacterium]|nr:MarR family transcriptional regulator [Xanthobacteraceae bacterium]
MSSPCFCTLLRKATRRLGSAYDEVLAPFGINIAQYSLLRMITRGGPLSLTELGRIAELDRSTIGRNVRVLERMGLLKTGRGEDDQREAVVILTARGTQVLEEATPAWERCQRTIENRLGGEKFDALQQILRAI